MTLTLYRLLTGLGGPLITLYLRRRMANGKEDRARFGERQGRPGLDRPNGPLVWLHAASVGESLSLLPLIERLRAARPDITPLVTTGTVTSARLLGERLPEGALHQYVPVDRPSWVRAFLDHWRPDLALWAESEFWPNLLRDTADRGVPMVLLNGRISDRSFATWQKQRRLIGALLGGFALCLGQTARDAERLAALGARRTGCVGNLKDAAAPLPADPDALAVLAEALGNRPLWLAASTHPGEEILAGEVHLALAPRFPDLLTVVVPRHPDRGPSIAAELARLNLTVVRRATEGPPTARCQVYVADTLGELGLFYRLAPVAFIGKSLAGHGGQNPLEAARLDCALVHGPHMDNFAEVAAGLSAGLAAETVADGAALADAVGRLLDDPAERDRRARAAGDYARSRAGVLDRVMAEIDPFLPPRAGDGADNEGA